MADQKLLRYRQTDFRGGINYEIEAARPDQVEDARNVWARRGALEGRPGSVGVTSLYDANTLSGTMNPVTDAFFYANASAGGAFVNIGPGVQYDMRNLDVGDVLYMGHGSANYTGIGFQFATGSTLVTSTGNARIEAEYYNGTEWQPIIVQGWCGIANAGISWTEMGMHYLFQMDALSPSLAIATQKFCGYNWVPPKDWAPTVVNGSASLYYVRFTIAEGDVTAASTLLYSAGTNVTATNGIREYATSPRVDGCGVFNWTNGGKAYWAALREYSSTSSAVSSVISYRDNLNWYSRNNYCALKLDNTLNTSAGGIVAASYLNYDRPRSRATLASIPEFGVAYMGAAGRVAKIVQYPPVPRGDVTGATNVHNFDFYESLQSYVERDPAIVGLLPGLQKAIYHPDYIVQRTSWPPTDLMLWFNSTIFASGDISADKTYYWTAPTFGDVKGLAVWPEVSQETVSGAADASRVTALSVQDEHVLVWKRDSIYRVVYAGETPEGLSNYTAVCLQQGIGTTSPDSLARLPMGTAFLYDDGIYIYDGVGFKKISRPIDNYIRRIVPGARVGACAVHWASRRCYMLSVAIDGSDVNNVVFVWDYENDAWWVWDNISAQGWMNNQDETDDEQIFYVDDQLCVFQLKENCSTDHGRAIPHSVKTHRFGFKEERAKNFGELRVMSNNLAASCNASLIVQERSEYTTKTMVLTDTAEAKVGTAVLGTSKLTAERYRERHVDFPPEFGVYAQAYITHSTKYEPFKIVKIDIGAEEVEIP